MSKPEHDPTSDLRVLLLSLERYHAEEHAQAQRESDERRRAWHDGRASAYADVAERLIAVLNEAETRTAPENPNN
ncbi:hypothetical protein [Deinococcus pimensis]|uniref:hypothetical protein n=1 Tax=Deinococcus pimensis TaxID=309888 RepID=UPI000489B84F|nr:hypothetical protein [Deinococcus pimensis]